MTPANVDDALKLLGSLGASPWLVRHHELVAEAALVICDRLARDLAVVCDRDLVLVGAALHDAGKIVHPDEMTTAGHRHEPAGQALLAARGVPASISRFCITHARWDAEQCTLEDELVALADKLWKGKRDAALENQLVARIAASTAREPWHVFDRFDAICEAVAVDGPERLARSVV